jgi:alkylation response protein AidB-like acyl-CoA dehydrogenase
MSEFSADDRNLLGESVQRFAEKEYTREFRRDVLSGAKGYSPEIWAQMGELGLLGLAVPAAQGGSGGSMQELGLVMEVVGRHLMMEPYLETAVVCAPLVAQLDPDGQVVDLGEVMAGGRILALAHSEPQLGFARSPIATRVESSAAGARIFGRKSFVLGGPVAQDLLVTALDEDGRLGVFAVSPEDKGLRMRSFRSVDGRWVADLELEGAAGKRLGEDDAQPAVDQALDRAMIAVGFEAVGSMQLLVDETRQHIKTRRAFGGTLSQFQVLRHRVVDMFVLAEEAAAIVLAAAEAVERQAPEGARLAAAAKVHVSRAGRFVSESAVQLHGGLGVSDEMFVSHHFKRLMMIEALQGDGDHNLDRFVDLTLRARVA